MNELQQSTTGVVCLVDDQVEHRALIYAVALRLGLRFACDEHLNAFQPGMLALRPACLIIADRFLPKSDSEVRLNSDFSDLDQRADDLEPTHSTDSLDFTGNHLATIVLCEQPHITDVVKYMRAGAIGVLAEPHDPELIAQWIHEALRVDRQRFRTYCRAQELAKTYSQFSRRKQVVLRHMVDGRASKWSAHTLDVSRRTIELDRAEILAAFGASNAIELARAVGPWLDQLHWETPHVTPKAECEAVAQ